MRKSRFTESQIVSILREGEAGVPIAEIVRKHGISKNPLWGAPRIHGEVLKLGLDVAQATVSRYMPRGRRPPSQTWRTFLKNHATAIASTATPAARRRNHFASAGYAPPETRAAPGDER